MFVVDSYRKHNRADLGKKNSFNFNITVESFVLKSHVGKVFVYCSRTQQHFEICFLYFDVQYDDKWNVENG